MPSPSPYDYKTLHHGKKSTATRDLATALNKRLRSRSLADRQVKVYEGAMTLTSEILEAAVSALYVLGAPKTLWQRVEETRSLPPEAIVVIRHPKTAARLGHRDPDVGERRVAHLRAKRKRFDKGFKVITAADLGLTFQWVFGNVGALARTYGHYTAGPRASDRSELIKVTRDAHSLHAGKGWGGCSYSVLFADDGTIMLANPIGRKAAGVAGHNTGSVHLNCPGTTGDHATERQEAALRWYMQHAHTTRIPRAHRSPVDLRNLSGRVHKDDNPTACPGDFTTMYRRVL